MPAIGAGITIGAGVSITDTPGTYDTGLYLYLDAGITASYPGTGTTWSDLSGSSVYAKPYSTYSFPTYSSGGLVFDGSTMGLDFANWGTSYSDNFTYEFWCIPTATHQIDPESTSSTTGTSGQKYIIGASHQGTNGGAGVSIGTNGVSVYEHGSGYMPPLLVSQTAISNSVPTQITVVYTSKTPRLYINGQFDKVGLTSPKAISYQTGYSIGNGSYGFFQGTMYTMRYYNTSLTQAQTMQNFQAFRSRFGI